MTFRQAEEYLLGLELFGMRFGLDRMRRLMTVLGLPQRRFESIHVVGTNGKSSTVRFTAAILERHGMRTGSYTSPHLRSFRERVEVGEAPVSEQDFAAAVEQAAHAAGLVDRTADPDDVVTQFEALTAAAYHELARQRGGGGGGRGRPGRALRRHQRDPLARAGAHRHRPRAHALARPAHRGHRGGEAGGGAGRRDAGGAAGPRSGRVAPWPSASRASAGRAWCSLRRPMAPVSTCAPPASFQRANFALAAAAAEAFLGRALDPAAVAAAGARDARGRAGWTWSARIR